MNLAERLHRPEILAAWLIGGVLALDAVLLIWRGSSIAAAAFAGNIAVALMMIVLALAYRHMGRAAEIATTLIACSFFILFSNAGAVLNNLLIAPGSATIDPLLFRADAALGFDWRAFAIAMSDYPALCRVLSWTYQSSLVQMAVVLIWLGFTGKRVNLHRFLLVGMIASCVTMAFWTLAPSFGPSPYVSLPAEVDARIGRVVDAGYGERLLALAAHGAPPVIGQEHLMGLIAFPSMHTVMALMTTLFARGTRLFWPLVLINLLMIPAILLQGGHHVVDVIGGTALFFAVQALVRRIVPDHPGELAVRSQRLEERPFPA